MKNKLKNNRRKGEVQNKQWERAVAPNSCLVSAYMCAGLWIYVCVRAHEGCLLYDLHYGLVLNVSSSSVHWIFSAFILTVATWTTGLSHKESKLYQTNVICKQRRKMHSIPVCYKCPMLHNHILCCYNNFNSFVCNLITILLNFLSSTPLSLPTICSFKTEI